MKIGGSVFKIAFSFIFLLIVSWILLHTLAFLGIFLALVYPVWWLLAPQATICMLCRSRKEGDTCPFCHEEVRKGSSYSPRNLRSVLLNSFLIFVFSIASIFIVYGEGYLLSRSSLIPPEKTVVFNIPTKGQYTLGREFEMKVELSDIREPINTVQADFSFDHEVLELVDISTQDSFANIFIQKEINNEHGFGRLTGGIPNPGFSGDQGLFATIIFKGIRPGTTEVEFLPTSVVLANDGKGSNILKSFANTSFLILPKGSLEEEINNINNNSVKGTSDGNQLIFYDESDVLGESNITTEQPQEELIDEPLTFSQKVAKVIHTIDEKIINFYSNILEIIKID